jgi:predicted Zn-dependent peptidase
MGVALSLAIRLLITESSSYRVDLPHRNIQYSEFLVGGGEKMYFDKFDLKLTDGRRTYYKKTFHNKCQIIVEQIPSFFTVSIGVWIKIGSKYEKINQKGISHLVEHLLFCGTQNRSSQDIVNHIESVGGKIDACTERELTCFSVKLLKEDISRGMELLFDLVTSPNFYKESINKEKEIILREIEEGEEDYQLRVHDLLIENMFPNSLGYPIYGDKESLNKIDIEQIQQFYKDYYIPENIVIAATGDFEGNNVLGIVEKTFGSMANKQCEYSLLKIPEVKPNVLYHRENTEQTYFCLGTEGLKQTDEDRVVMYIISSVLGEGMSSRLYKKIREEAGLAYTIYSYYTLYAETGAFIITGIISNEKLHKAIDIIKVELDSICSGDISNEELNMAKAKLKGNFFFNIESVENAMIRLAKLNDWHGKHFTISEELKMIERVTLNDVIRVAKRLFQNNKWNLAIISNDSNSIKEGDMSI